eukprot:CAMPEP_0181289698 /NCGR_PEP_ID=MMETSP1101-20121128/1020_1 /TAXON_ID=46948 /ORGANISM="Rhodomonas abbreviata, Strain Caron Lab Isolate" /LENGTH=75 /DNA_ID=CAMNT_0023393935 /DNA_START=254 /DNA_END=481 /DNA_ORIENTATION=+
MISKLFSMLAFSGDYPGIFENPLADPAAFAYDGGDVNGGLSHIQDINSLPAYTWTNAHPDDYCLADACTPITLTE